MDVKKLEKGIFLKGVCRSGETLSMMSLMGNDDYITLFEAFVTGKDELRRAMNEICEKRNIPAIPEEEINSACDSGEVIFGWQNEAELRSFAKILTVFTGSEHDVAVYPECGLYMVAFYQEDITSYAEASMALVKDMSKHRKAYEIETMMW